MLTLWLTLTVVLISDRLVVLKPSDRNNESQVLLSEASTVCFERENRRRIVQPHKSWNY